MESLVLFDKVSAALAAFKAGDWRTLANLAGDLLKALAPVLPGPRPNTPELQPLTLPGGFSLDKVIALVQVLRNLFGK